MEAVIGTDALVRFVMMRVERQMELVVAGGGGVVVGTQWAHRWSWMLVMVVGCWHPPWEQTPGHLNTGWMQPALTSPRCADLDLTPHLFSPASPSGVSQQPQDNSSLSMQPQACKVSSSL